ncbi:diguanylate cyclase [Psychromonas arctica]|uniref:diguanylate cyclase n=1 Tax=Psychromonas arctica TaxID=168275 RepID=UPI002FD253C5
MPRNIKIFIFFFILFSHFSTAEELKQITLKTSWFQQFQFAGYYIAKEKGFYQQAGLNVTIEPFTIKSQSQTVQQVVSGQIDFAVGKEDLILDKSKHKQIVVLYALFQSSPLTLLTTKSSNIDTFADFPGKRIMTSAADAKQVSIKAMLNANHIRLSDLKQTPHSHNIEDLINGKTDIISAYISKSPYQLQKRGVDFNTFSPQYDGFDLYSDYLYTSEHFIAKDVKSTKSFKKASLKGWEYAFAHIDETVEILLEKYNEQNLTKEELIFEAVALKKLAYLNTPKIGVINKTKIQKSFDLYRVLGINEGTIDYEKFIYDTENPHIFFTAAEQKYLKNKQKITICIDPNWLPYEGLDSNGQHIGTNKAFFDIFRKQLPIPLEVIPTENWLESIEFAKQRKCDLLSLAAATEERKSYLSFTPPYLVFPRVLVTKYHLPFVNNFSLLANKRIGMVKGYAQQSLVRENYPNIIVVDVDNVKNGLKRVASGELYGFIDGLEAVSYFLKEDFLGQLKVSGKFDQKRELSIGVRNDDPTLQTIMNKLVNSLSQETIASVMDTSNSIKYIEKFNYHLLWWSLFIVIVIIACFLYRQNILNKLNKRLSTQIEEKTKALQELNESLESKIKERTKKIEHSKDLLRDVAYKDNLTNTFNRHYLIEQSQLFFKTADELNEPLSMLLIDIDYFKKVNDDFGHITGDKILKYFVKIIQEALRVDDLFARYGGEEFVILLPKAGLEESTIVAEKLRKKIEQQPYLSPRLNCYINVTISIGVSEYEQSDSLEKLIEKTDIALYQAKDNGRNQVQSI